MIHIQKVSLQKKMKDRQEGAPRIQRERGDGRWAVVSDGLVESNQRGVLKGTS